MLQRLGAVSLIVLAFFSTGADCGGGGSHCPARSALRLLVEDEPGGSLEVGRIVVTELDGLSYVDISANPPYIALHPDISASNAAAYDYGLFPTLAPEWARIPGSVLAGAVIERQASEPETAASAPPTISASVDIYRPQADGRLERVGRSRQTFSAVDIRAASVGTGGGTGGGGPDDCRSQ